MTDYFQDISGSTTLLIRDNGGWVDFLIRTGPSTWNNDQTYSFGANGSGSGIRKFRLVRGGGWQYIDHVFVTYDQNISFTIYDHGLGFPTYTLTVHIQRSTVPQAPTILSVVPNSQSTITVSWRLNYDGGSAPLEYQLGWGASSNGPTYLSGISGDDDTLTGLSAGQRVYCWVRVRNANGWSAWSNRGEATTWQSPPAPSTAIFVDVKQKSVGVNYPFIVRSGNPPNLEKQFKYGRDPTGVTIDATVNVDETIEYLSNLDAGKTYYFWARARNSVGWGPWTPTASVLVLIAGARVLVGGQWKRAIPYVRVGGVWKVAEPWVKDAGVWKRTAQ
jgi:hypothetical protein